MTVNSSALKLGRAVRAVRPSRGGLFGFIILGALVAFEAFNYSTTDFALADLLGDLRFLDVRWATILAIAFCGIDFAGIARLFTPQRGAGLRSGNSRDAGAMKETWYLFGAWLLAATMNAMLTWWGVAIAILSHQSLGGSVIDRTTMLEVVPVFVAIMVWLIRVLLIGSFSLMGERLFSQPRAEQRPQPPVMRRSSEPAAPVRGASKPVQAGYRRSEPTYHPAAMRGANQPRVLSRK